MKSAADALVVRAVHGADRLHTLGVVGAGSLFVLVAFASRVLMPSAPSMTPPPTSAADALVPVPGAPAASSDQGEPLPGSSALTFAAWLGHRAGERESLPYSSAHVFAAWLDYRVGERGSLPHDRCWSTSPTRSRRSAGSCASRASVAPRA
jgi:hypothetical protein